MGARMDLAVLRNALYHPLLALYWGIYRGVGLGTCASMKSSRFFAVLFKGAQAAVVLLGVCCQPRLAFLRSRSLMNFSSKHALLRGVLGGEVSQTPAPSLWRCSGLQVAP